MTEALRPRRRPSKAVLRRRTIVIASAIGVVAVAAIVAGILLLRPSPPAPVPTATPSRTPSPTPSATPTPTPSPTFDRTAQSIDDPSSYWVVVNKQRPITVLGYEATDIVAVPVPYINEPYLRQAAS